MDVSIIVPVYNNAPYVEKCIKSIINQKTKYSYEIIVVDVGSTDNSLEVLNQFKNDIILISKKKYRSW